tara:strand:- start:281 stop:742 length:462 start_codon:yes stop_codon:yes gene_type:complete
MNAATDTLTGPQTRTLDVLNAGPVEYGHTVTTVRNNRVGSRTKLRGGNPAATRNGSRVKGFNIVAAWNLVKMGLATAEGGRWESEGYNEKTIGHKRGETYTFTVTAVASKAERTAKVLAQLATEFAAGTHTAEVYVALVAAVIDQPERYYHTA